MEEINLRDLFSYFISKIFIVVIAISLAVFVSVVYSEFIKVPKYSSYATVVLATANDKDDKR